MSFSLSPELLLTIGIQLVTIIWFFASNSERVKRLEVDVLKLWKVQDEAKEKHETIVKMDAKLDLLLDRFIPKQG